MKTLSLKEKMLIALGFAFTVAFGIATVTVITEVVIRVINAVTA